MSIRKREWTSGDESRVAWVVDYRDQKGKRCLKTFKTKRAAKTWWETEAALDVARGTHTPDSASITVEEAGERWIANVQHPAEGEPCERSTVQQYRQHLDLHINPVIGREKLSRLSVPLVKDFQGKLRKQGRSPAMVKKVTASLGALVADAQDHGLVSRNVVRDIQPRRKRGQAKRHKRKLEVGIDIPTKPEIKAMLDGAQGRWRPLIVTAVFTGLRASELRGLRWRDVELDKALLHVRQRADRWNQIGPPKSEAGQRSIPLAPMVVNTLKEWKLACPGGDLDLVFPNGRGNVESLANIFSRGFAPLQIAAGVAGDTGKKDKQGQPVMKAKYGIHALRHAAASLFIEQGFRPKRIQALMGHSSIQMTFDTYGHLFPSEKEDQEAMEQLQARLLA